MGETSSDAEKTPSERSSNRVGVALGFGLFSGITRGNLDVNLGPEIRDVGGDKGRIDQSGWDSRTLGEHVLE